MTVTRVLMLLRVHYRTDARASPSSQLNRALGLEHRLQPAVRRARWQRGASGLALAAASRACPRGTLPAKRGARSRPIPLAPPPRRLQPSADGARANGLSAARAALSSVSVARRVRSLRQRPAGVLPPAAPAPPN